jgi:hypothetical protein
MGLDEWQGRANQNASLLEPVAVGSTMKSGHSNWGDPRAGRRTVASESVRFFGAALFDAADTAAPAVEAFDLITVESARLLAHSNDGRLLRMHHPHEQIPPGDV